MSVFPLDITNDWSSYMAQLHFLKECGFHEMCYYWYNGFMTFYSTPPGWYYFTLPLYLIFNSVTVASFISLILIYVLAFVAIYYFGKLHEISPTKRIAFFLLFLANAVTIGNFIRLGRLHELLGWVLFIILAFTLLWYKDRKLDNKYFLVIIPYSLILLAHQVVAIFASVLLFSLFLIKNFKEKIYVALSVVLSLLITAFWWVPYVLNFSQSRGVDIIMSKTLLLFDSTHLPQNIITFLAPIGLCFIFYYYWKDRNKSKKELIFFLPTLILASLLFFRISPFIPGVNYLYPDSYIYYFTFLGLFMLFKTKLKTFSLNIRRLILIAFILIPIVSVLANIYHTPSFTNYTQLEEDTVSILEYVDGNFIMIQISPPTSYGKAYYSMAPVYYNLTTASGWHVYESKEYYGLMKKIESGTTNCFELNALLKEAKITDVISHDDYCDVLDNCELKEIKHINRVCLYKNDKV